MKHELAEKMMKKLFNKNSYYDIEKDLYISINKENEQNNKQKTMYLKYSNSEIVEVQKENYEINFIEQYGFVEEEFKMTDIFIYVKPEDENKKQLLLNYDYQFDYYYIFEKDKKEYHQILIQKIIDASEEFYNNDQRRENQENEKFNSLRGIRKFLEV